MTTQQGSKYARASSTGLTLVVALVSGACANDTSEAPYCGDGVLNQVSEFCDTNAYRDGDSCRDWGFLRGSLDCDHGCRVLTNDCEPALPSGAMAVCGNELLEPGEECDLVIVAGQDCARLGLGEGALSCAEDCTVDTSECSLGHSEGGGDTGTGSGGSGSGGGTTGAGSCGDGLCMPPSEDCHSCAQDCGVCGPSCGDGVCEETENCDSCAQDCACTCDASSYWSPTSRTQSDPTGRQANQSIDVTIDITVRESGAGLEVRVCKQGSVFEENVALHIADSIHDASLNVVSLATANNSCSPWTQLVHDNGYLEGELFSGSWQLVSPGTVAEHWGWPSDNCLVEGEPWGTCWNGAGIQFERTCRGL